MGFAAAYKLNSNFNVEYTIHTATDFMCICSTPIQYDGILIILHLH